MKIRVDYIETVWNSYEVNGFPEDDFEDTFENVLKNKYGGNVWAMMSDIPGMSVELSEPCFDFIDVDYEKVEVDC